MQMLQKNLEVGPDDLEDFKIAQIIKKLGVAQNRKDKGNEYFKKNDLKQALKYYHHAMMYIKGVNADMNPPLNPEGAPKIDDATRRQLDLLTAGINNNIAACLLKKTPIPYERVVQCCETATTLQKDNARSWYRLAVALHGLHKTDKAREAINKAVALNGNKDIAIRKLNADIAGAEKAERIELNNLYKNMNISKWL